MPPVMEASVSITTERNRVADGILVACEIVTAAHRHPVDHRNSESKINSLHCHERRCRMSQGSGRGGHCYSVCSRRRTGNRLVLRSVVAPSARCHECEEEGVSGDAENRFHAQALASRSSENGCYRHKQGKQRPVVTAKRYQQRGQRCCRTEGNRERTSIR